jgi:hypothetical protein
VEVEGVCAYFLYYLNRATPYSVKTLASTKAIDEYQIGLMTLIILKQFG